MSTVIITGAGGGLGSALAIAFAGVGYDLILNHRRRPIQTDLIQHMRDVEVEAIAGDLIFLETLDRIVEAAKRRQANILINCAGVHFNKRIDELTDCDMKEVINTNLVMPMILTRKLWQILKESGDGIVVNVNSFAGLEGAAGEIPYCASKHGLAGFSKALQFDGVRDKVQIMNIYLGKINTIMTDGCKDQDLLMEPAEVANVILSLCHSHPSLRVTEITLVRRNY